MSQAISEELQREFRRAPFIASLGMRLEGLGEGECTTALDVEERHLQQQGVVHAGVLATMADHTAGAAASTLSRAGQAVLTVEFKINLLRAARGERLICRSKVLKPGSQISVVESEVYCVAAGREYLAAKATATLAAVAIPQ